MSNVKETSTQGAPHLTINVANKVAYLLPPLPRLVCCNDDYIVQFRFDSEWDDVPDKMARFIFNGQHYDRPIDAQGLASVPGLHGPDRVVKIGVYSPSDAGMRTTTPASVGVYGSVLDENSTENASDTAKYTSEAKEAAERAEAAADKAAEFAANIHPDNMKAEIVSAVLENFTDASEVAL